MGQLGDNTDTQRSSPTQIPGSWNQMYAGYYQTLGTKTDGTTWVWGSGWSGALGQNSITPNNQGFSSPVQVMGKNEATNITSTNGGFLGIFSPPG